MGDAFAEVYRRAAYHAVDVVAFVEEEFGGSLPKFLTAFIGKEKLTDAQVEEMKALIESYREE